MQGRSKHITLTSIYAKEKLVTCVANFVIDAGGYCVRYTVDVWMQGGSNGEHVDKSSNAKLCWRYARIDYGIDSELESALDLGFSVAFCSRTRQGSGTCS